MSKKILFDPIPSRFALLNKSYNNLKRTGHETLFQFKEYLEDDNIRELFHVKEAEFESLKIEIFDLSFLIRLEIELAPSYNSFQYGMFKTYRVSEKGLEDISIEFLYNQKGQIFDKENSTVSPDYIGILDFVLHFINRLFKHITTNKYITIPNSSYEQ